MIANKNGAKTTNSQNARNNANQNGNSGQFKNNKFGKNKKKKQKDAVITPFNPVQATYGPQTTQSYEIAAQQLGLNNIYTPNVNPSMAQSLPYKPTLNGANV